MNPTAAAIHGDIDCLEQTVDSIKTRSLSLKSPIRGYGWKPGTSPAGGVSLR